MQSLKDLALFMSKKKQIIKHFSNKKICLLSPLNMCEFFVLSRIFMIFLKQSTIVNLNLMWLKKNKNIFSSEIHSRSLKMVWMGKAQEYYHHAKFNIFPIFSVPKNHNIKVFVTYRHSSAGWPASWPTSQLNTDCYILTFFMPVKNLPEMIKYVKRK